MTKFLHSFLIALLLILAGCSKGQFKLEFQLPADLNTNYTAIYYASDKRGGMTIETVALIQKGKGELKCPAVNPTVLYLYVGPGTPLAIFAERGDKIEISGTDDNPYDWTVKGNEVNEALSEWRNANSKALSLNNPDSTNLAVARYVLANRESPISPLLLLTSFSRNDNETLFRQLWQGLQGEALDTDWAEIISRADIPDGRVRTPGRLVSLALRSAGTGLDTIRPDSVKATLLFFWNNGFPSRKQTFDSIKALTREYPDSSSRIIADICLDPDSTSWRSPLRADSVKKVLRMWAPQGIADKRINALGVTRTPFYIVLSPDGHQRYRGSDQKEAFSSFRSLLPKP